MYRQKFVLLAVAGLMAIGCNSAKGGTMGAVADTMDAEVGQSAKTEGTQTGKVVQKGKGAMDKKVDQKGKGAMDKKGTKTNRGTDTNKDTNNKKGTNNNKINIKEKGTMVQELTLKGFKENVMDYEKNREWVFEGKRPAIIDFYATWCGPCKATAPHMEEIAKAYDGKVDVYKVDVDKEQELASLFGIRSIPTILFIPMKGQPQAQVGAMDYGQIDEAVKAVLLAK